MPKFSAFTSFGQLRFRAAPSKWESIYRSMRDGLGADKVFDMSTGTDVEADLYATSRVIAAADAALERAGNQAQPSLVTDLLPNMERDYQAVPAETDTISDRRARLAALKLLPSGATMSNIVALLRALLGDAFLAYYPIRDETQRYPVSMSASTQVQGKRIDVPARVVVLVDPVGVLAAPVWTRYTNANPEDAEVALLVGETVIVQPDNTGISERVTISGVSGSGATRQFEATFTNAHDEGAIVTTGHWPWQYAMTHHHLVVLTSAAARDAQTRRDVEDLLRRVLRGPDTWSIVEPTATTTTSVTVGPTTVSSTIGTVVIGAITIPRSF